MRYFIGLFFIFSGTSFAQKESFFKELYVKNLIQNEQKSGLKKRFDMNQISFSISCDKAVS